MSEVVEDKGIVNRFVGRAQHDDRIDLETDISSGEALHLLGRCLQLLGEVRALFFAKVSISTLLILPGLMLPWISKIIIDNVLLQQELGDSDVPYPPFMTPIVNFLTGMTPLEIMFSITMGYVVAMVLIGTRAGEGVYVGLFGGDAYSGQDETAQAENKISSGFSSAGGLLGIIDYWISVRLNQAIGNNLRTRLFARFTRLPMTTLSDQRTGDSIYRVLYDTASIPSATYDMTINLFLVLIGAAINMYLINYSYTDAAPQLVWIAWCVLPVAFVVTFPVSSIMRRINQSKRSAGAATTNAMEEIVGNVDAVQSLGGMEQESERFAKRSLESYFRERAAFVVGILLFVVAGFAVGAIALYVVFLITDNIIEGRMSPGDFGVLFGIFFGIASGALEIGIFWLNMQNRVAPARRIFFFIDYESDDDQTGGLPLRDVEQGVTIDHVSFNYPDGREALSDISLDLPLGKVIALVGPSGAGKTSLGYLLPGFLKPTQGRVLIDGQDAAELDVDSVRNHVAYVFQEHLLLAESIRENLLIARPDASDEEIITALRSAGAMEFIDQMPDGIDTVLGRSGNTLSVGQQQRLCIARGLVRNAKILILDEPTAALDPETENRLFDALHGMSEGRLIIVIAHRLSTVRQADRIVFLDEGRVIEQGTHQELMDIRSGRYRQFVGLTED